jgi:hypothetical protein
MIGESYTRWRVIGVVQYTPINDHRRAYWLDHQLSDGEGVDIISWVQAESII